MLHRWRPRRLRRPILSGPYDTASGRWTQFGMALEEPPWTDDNVIRYPSLAALINDPISGRDVYAVEVARDMHGDQPASPWRRSWSQDRKALRNED